MAAARFFQEDRAVSQVIVPRRMAAGEGRHHHFMRKLLTNGLQATAEPSETKPISICVTVHKGRGLPPRDSNGLSDPYVVLQYGVNSAKTKIVRKNLNPEWNETFNLGSLIADENIITLKVWDWDYLVPKH